MSDRLRKRIEALSILYRDPDLNRELEEVANDLVYALFDSPAEWQENVAFMEGVE